MSQKENSRRISDYVVIALRDSDRIDGFFTRPGSERFEVFDAFDGRAGQTHPMFDTATFVARNGAPPLPGELGCAVSHYLVLRDFVARSRRAGDYLVVAEDDVRLTADFLPVLNNVLRRPRELEMVLLTDSWGTPPGSGKSRQLDIPAISPHMSWISTPVGPGFNPFRYRLARFRNTAWGAHLYLIRKDVAEKYVAYVEQRGGISWVADDYNSWAEPCQIDLKMLNHTLSYSEGQSTIGHTDLTGQESHAPASFRERLALRTRLAHIRGGLLATIDDLCRRR